MATERRMVSKKTTKTYAFFDLILRSVYYVCLYYVYSRFFFTTHRCKRNPRASVANVMATTQQASADGWYRAPQTDAHSAAGIMRLYAHSANLAHRKACKHVG